MTTETYDVDAMEVINGTYYHTEDVRHMLRTVVEAIHRGASKAGQRTEFQEYNKELHIRFASGDCKATVDNENMVDDTGVRKWHYKLVIALSRRNKLHSSPLALLGHVEGSDQVPEDLVLGLCIQFALKVVHNRHIFGHNKTHYSVREEDVKSFLRVNMPVVPTVRIEAKAESNSRKAARKAMLTERVNRNHGRRTYLDHRASRLETEIKDLREQIDRLTNRINGDTQELAELD